MGLPSSEPLRLRSVALPAEHGGWGMLGEPLLLGLLLAPSVPGLAVAAAGTFAFLARHPLKLAVADWRSGRRTRRTGTAERMTLLYAGLAAAGLSAAGRSASAWWWLPFVIAAPLALVQFIHDVRHQGRRLGPELLGGVALASVAAAVVLAGGASLPMAAALWSLLAAKTAGAILYVRARLRCDRDLDFDRRGTLALHGLGVGLAVILAAARLAPWSAAAGFAILLARAVLGLSRFHRRVRPQVVGITEMAYGLAFVLVCAVGYRLAL
jgi:hypothetical protein